MPRKFRKNSVEVGWHDNGVPVRNGGYQIITAEYTITIQDKFINFTSGTGNVLAPDITSDWLGFELVLINSRGTTFNFIAHNTDSLNDGGGVAAGATARYLCNGVSTWRRIA